MSKSKKLSLLLNLEQCGLKKGHVFTDKQKRRLDECNRSLAYWYPRILSLPKSLAALAQTLIDTGVSITTPYPKVNPSSSWDSWQALVSPSKKHEMDLDFISTNLGMTFGNPIRFIAPDRKFLMQLRLVVSMAHDVNMQLCRLMKCLGLSQRPGWSYPSSNIYRLRLKLEKYATDKRYETLKMAPIADETNETKKNAIQKKVAKLMRRARTLKASLSPYALRLYMQNQNLEVSIRKQAAKKAEAIQIALCIPDTFEARIAVDQFKALMSLEAQVRKLTTHNRNAGPLISILG